MEWAQQTVYQDEATVHSRLLCDLTQSWSRRGGGVRTYLNAKRRHILERTPHRHLMILPGRRDATVEEGRAITVTIAAPRVPGNPNYRLLLRNDAVKEALARYRPAIIECQDSYNLPWAALSHRQRYPETALVAGFFTDFPTVYVGQPVAKAFGRTVSSAAARLGYRYLGNLYRRFDGVFGLSESGGVARLRALGLDEVGVLPLGIDLADFDPRRRDPALRSSLGLGEDQPLLIYAGRLDIEKRPDIVVEAFRRLPPELGARLVLLGDGPLRDSLAGEGVFAPGFVSDRDQLARWLASADIYVSAMANETFGVSVIEAQASGLPVVGVAAGAMLDRVDERCGRLGPVGDAEAMARNILDVCRLGPAAMGAAGRELVVRQFSWERSMELLLGDIYPRALDRAAERLAASPVPLRSAFARAWR